jgi:chromosome segregation ATPase
MKKIAAALGLIQAATEAQIIEAITKLKNDLATATNVNKELRPQLDEALAHIAATKGHSEQQVSTIDKLQADNDAKAVEIKELTDALQACAESNPQELTEEEAIAKATETLLIAEIAVGYPTSDGTVFTNENEAAAYANANRLKVLDVIKTK